MVTSDAWVQFAQAQVAAWEALANNLVDGPRPAPGPPSPMNLEDQNLGIRQLQIVKLPGLRSEGGLKTAEISEQIDRSDIPNTYTSLQALAQRGIVELVPNKSPQHWRLTGGLVRPYPWEDVDMDMTRGRDADGRHYVRCCCGWLTSSIVASQVFDALRTHVDRCPEAQMASIEQKRVIERIMGAETIEEMDAIFRDVDDDPAA